MEEINNIYKHKRYWFAQNASLVYKQRLIQESFKKIDSLGESDSVNDLDEKHKLENTICSLIADINRIKEYLAFSSDFWFYPEKEFFSEFNKKFPSINRSMLNSWYLPLYNSALNSDIEMLKRPLAGNDKMPKMIDRSFNIRKKSLLKTKSLNSLKKSNSFKFDELKKNLIESVSAEGSFMSPVEKKALVSIGEALAVLNDSDSKTSAYIEKSDFYE